MGLAVVPMLQYVLPFAAGFGATLAYHRMTHDNELTGAKAGGISHRALLVPALVTGLMVGAGLSELNGYVIPRFLRSMESMVAQDAAQMVFRTIDSGQAVVVKNRLIYADKVYQVTPESQDPDGPTDVLVLTRVAALELGPGNEVLKEATAAQATLAFFRARESDGPVTGGRPPGGLSQVVLEMKNSRAYDKKGRTEAGSGTVVFPIAGVFSDNPRYNTNRELAELPADPDRINFIDAQRHTLAYRLAEHDMIAAIASSLKGRGHVRLTGSENRTYTIKAAGLRWNKSRWELIPPGQDRPVEVEMIRASAKGVPDPSDRLRFTARTAGLTIDRFTELAVRSVTLSLEMEFVTVQARENEPATQLPTLSRPSLAPTENPLPRLLAMNTYAMLAEAAKRPAAERDASTDDAARELQRRLDRLLREAVSHQHERAALAGACLVMVLIGALTAMRMGESLPLTVYLWSFFPALLSVISISAGQSIAYQIGSWGLVVLWAGLAVLTAYALAAFWMVRRH
jgi:lipopolysaccharide export LptBFGC system permease protein LptF